MEFPQRIKQGNRRLQLILGEESQRHYFQRSHSSEVLENPQEFVASF